MIFYTQTLQSSPGSVILCLIAAMPGCLNLSFVHNPPEEGKWAGTCPLHPFSFWVASF